MWRCAIRLSRSWRQGGADPNLDTGDPQPLGQKSGVTHCGEGRLERANLVHGVAYREKRDPGFQPGYGSRRRLPDLGRGGDNRGIEEHADVRHVRGALLEQRELRP